jgi:DNA-binding transcriptional MerR regulator
MRYTVKQLANLAGVTARTLHYYDEIGLLRPAEYGENGYRYYSDEALLRLQQILFYRELDFNLDQIRAILDRPDFNLLNALQTHRAALFERINRLNCLIETVDNTMKHLRGEFEMEKKDFYKGFDEEKQKRYEQQVRERWGDEAMDKTKDWNAYTRAEKNDILAQMHEISASIAANMDKGPESAEVQHWIGRWHKHIDQYFYPCSLEIFEALGHGYVEDPEFRATYEGIRPGMAAFMEKAMTLYCKK